MINCPICKNTNTEIRLRNIKDMEYGCLGKYNFMFCKNCGVFFIDPQPSLESLKKSYPPDYHAFHSGEGGFITFLYSIVNRLRFREYTKITGPAGKILDVGCSDAAYFDFLKKYSPAYELSGIEFKDEIAQLGRNKGRDIFTGTLAEYPSNEKFDLIIMNNLIEHVLDPVCELKKARTILKANGHVILETPNINSWDFILFKSLWGGIHAPRHTFLFNPASLKALALKTGFKVLYVNFPLNTDHWALSVQNFLQNTKLLRVKLKRGRAWYFKILLIVFLPVNLIQKFLGKTGSFTAVLEKV